MSFKISEGTPWLRKETSLSEEELQFILEEINADTYGEDGRVLSQEEISRFRPDNDEETEVHDLLIEWNQKGYQAYHFVAPGSPAFLLIDDGDGYFETEGSRDALFLTGEEASQTFRHYLRETPLQAQPPIVSLHQKNIYRLKEAYFRASGRYELFNFEDIAGLLENIALGFGDEGLNVSREQDYQFVQQWFLSRREDWDPFELKLGVALLLELGKLGGGSYVAVTLNELSSAEWATLFRDPHLSLEILRALSDTGRQTPESFPVHFGSRAARLIFEAAFVSDPAQNLDQVAVNDLANYFGAVLGKNITDPASVFPGELLIALVGLKHLLIHQAESSTPPGLLNRTYHFIAAFETVSPENMEVPQFPVSVPPQLFDQERWVKAATMDVNLAVMTEAFAVLELAGSDGRTLRDELDQTIAEDRDPGEPEEILTALTMILHAELPDVKRSEAYVQFYKRVLARKMLADRRGDRELSRELARLQTMNQIGRELEGAFWQNRAFRESLLAGHEEGLDRQLKTGLDSSDKILSRNFLQLTGSSEDLEDEVSFSLFWQMLNETPIAAYPIGGEEARAQALAATFALRSWTSGIHGQVEDYFDFLETSGDPDFFTVTERMAFLHAFESSDLRHLVPQYLFRFFDDPNALVREKAFTIYAELGYPTAITRNLLGRHFGFSPQERKNPQTFMRAAERLKLRPSTQEIVQRIVTNPQHKTQYFLRPRQKVAVAPWVGRTPRGESPRFFLSETGLHSRSEELLAPDPRRPFAYRCAASTLALSSDPRAIPVLVDAILLEAPVAVGDRPLSVVMPALDGLAEIFGLADRAAIEAALVRTIAHQRQTGLVAESFPKLLLQWGRRNHVDVVTAFRRALFTYDAGPGDHPAALDQLMGSLYNEMRREYLTQELRSFGLLAIQELTRRITILSKKIEDGATTPTERERYLTGRAQLLEILLAVQ